MNAELGKHDDGMIGLGLLALMTIALVAGQFHAPEESAASFTPTSRLPVISETNQERSAVLRGAIRELRIVPSIISNASDLEWSSDEELIDSYRKAGF